MRGRCEMYLYLYTEKRSRSMSFTFLWKNKCGSNQKYIFTQFISAQQFRFKNVQQKHSIEMRSIAFTLNRIWRGFVYAATHKWLSTLMNIPHGNFTKQNRTKKKSLSFYIRPSPLAPNTATKPPQCVCVCVRT